MSASTAAVSLKKFKSPESIVGRFFTKRALRSSAILGLVVAIFMITKAASYLSSYPSEAARAKIAASLGNNIGIEALLGTAKHTETMAGFVTWSFLSLTAAAGAIWALLMATKYLRGEEDSGRWELFLSGLVNARTATSRTIVAMTTGLGLAFILFGLGVLYIGHMHDVSFTASAIWFMALALTAGAAEFMAIGSLTSQLMSTRAKANAIAVAVFGLFYALRLIADTTSATWLLNISPLGWVEKLQPLYDSQAIWLIPIILFTVITFAVAIFLSGRRDLGESIIKARDYSKPHYYLLGSSLGFAVRITKNVNLGWLGAVALAALVYGQLANKTIVNSLSSSGTAGKEINRLSQTTQSRALTTATFLGITFFIIMMITMFYAASSVGRVREDEAEGFLDNLIVRPVSRLRWLAGRVGLILVIIGLAGLVSSIAMWFGQASQPGGASFHSLFTAGMNAIIPAIFVLGVSIFAFGLLPRYTIIISYTVIAWSFLITMLSSGINLNHWLLDTSLFRHVLLAPAVNPNWHTNLIIALFSLVLIIVGFLAFNNRDIQTA